MSGTARSKAVEEKTEAVAEVLPVTNPQILSDEDLATSVTWEDFSHLINENNLPVINAADLGSGFSLVDNKDVLLNVEFMIVGWYFRQGNHGEYVSVECVTRDNRKLVFNDGSSGIYSQLKQLTFRLIKAGVYGGRAITHVHKGLTKSEYSYVDENGAEKTAKTYYLSTSR